MVILKFDLMSRNTMILIDECLKNQDLVKLIHYNEKNPLNQPNVTSPSSLVMKKIYPSPATLEVPELQEVNLRIFFSNGILQNDEVLNSRLVFQVVLHNNLWNMVRKDGQKAVRAYDIMSKIVDIFEDRTIKTVGVIHFDSYNWQNINKDYSLYNLEATMTTL